MPESEGTKGTTQTTNPEGVSIIVPCYYDWERVKPCLDAIRKQTGVAIQLILVYNKQPGTDPKDALKNGLGDYAKKYNEENKESSCVVIYPDVKKYESYNYSASAARNIGLDSVTKKTVMFIDDDDVIGWQPEKTEIDEHYVWNFYKALQNDDNVAMIAGDNIKAEMKDGNITIPKEKKFNIYPTKEGWTENNGLENAQGMIFLRERLTCCATLYRTELINDPNGQLRFDTKMRFQEDSKFVMQYALKAALKPFEKEDNTIYQSMGSAIKFPYALQPNMPDIIHQEIKNANFKVLYDSNGVAWSGKYIVKPVKIPEPIVNTIVESVTGKIKDNLIEKSFYAYIQHDDSVMNKTQTTREDIHKRDRDNLEFSEWITGELSRITADYKNTCPVFAPLYNSTINVWYLTLVRLVDEIDTLIQNKEQAKNYTSASSRMPSPLDIGNYIELVGDSATKLQEIIKNSTIPLEEPIVNKVTQFRDAIEKVKKRFPNSNMQDIANIPQQDDSGYEY